MLLVSLFALRQQFSFAIHGEERWFDQRLDHFDSHSDVTFSQRYFVNDEFSQGKDVNNIILYIGGESELRETKITSGAVMELAERTSSLLLALEHRFFGKSYPKMELTADTYKYLTISQALEDLSHFLNVSVNRYCRDPTNCTVAVVGGSYPGSLSSWMRMKYPSLVAASWASSAPVWVLDDFVQYDEHVTKMLKELKGYSCWANLKEVYSRIESIIKSGDRAQIDDMKKKLGFTLDQDDISVLYVIADSVAGPVQYKKWQYLLDDLCDSIGNGDNWESFIYPFQKINEATGGTPQSMDLMILANTSLEFEERDHRSWNWMTCNEVGWFQTASKDESKRLRSSLVNISYFDRMCQTVYGIPHSIPDYADLTYGSDNPASTNVYFTNGATDPWSELSVKVADHKLDRFADVAKEGAHCTDLLAPSPEDDKNLTRLRAHVISTMEMWMKNSNAVIECQNGGVRIMSKCKCIDNWGGHDCSIKTHKKMLFQVVTISAVAVTTILLLIIGFAVWVCGKREESEFGARPTLYTN